MSRQIAKTRKGRHAAPQDRIKYDSLAIRGVSGGLGMIYAWGSAKTSGCFWDRQAYLIWVGKFAAKTGSGRWFVGIINNYIKR